MSELKIQTGDGVMVPGQDTAKKQQEEQTSQAEYDANLLYKKDKAPSDTGPDYTYSKIRFRRSDEVNIYADEQDKRYSVDPRMKTIGIMAVAMVLVCVWVIVSPTNVFGYDRINMSLALYISEFTEGIHNFIGLFISTDSNFGLHALTIVVTLLAGAAMGLSGGIFQGSLKNALASPSTLGVMSGGTVGSLIYAVFVYPNSVDYLTTTVAFTSYEDLKALYDSMTPWEYFMEQWGGFFCSLFGCCVVVFLVMAMALIAGRGKVSNVALVIAGQVFTQVISLVMDFIRNWLTEHGDPDTAVYVAQAQSASFTGAYTLPNVIGFAIPLIACMAVCFLMAPRLSLLAFNDEEAKSMGISTVATRNFMVGICTVMTALVVSFCGAVGFVGFMVPHIARKYIGPDFKFLLPACAIIGAIMVCVTYWISNLGIPYLVGSGTGMLTSIIGSVSFVIVALRGRRSSGGEWL